MSWECVSYWIEHHPGLASWVQAFGSIAAILVAMWLSGSERRAHKRMEERARIDAITRSLSALENALDQANIVISSMCVTTITGPLTRTLSGTLLRTLAHLQEVSSSPGVDSEIAGAIFDGRICIEGLIHELGTWFEDIDTGEPPLDTLAKHADGIGEAIGRLKDQSPKSRKAWLRWPRRLA